MSVWAPLSAILVAHLFRDSDCFSPWLDHVQQAARSWSELSFFGVPNFLFIFYFGTLASIWILKMYRLYINLPNIYILVPRV